MKVKVSEASGAVLDWMVCKALFPDYLLTASCAVARYSTKWSQGGPIIEREGITASKEDGCWSAYFRDNLFEDDGSEHWQTGPTPLVAAMRCYVASKLGDEVEVPDDLA